MFNAMQLHFEMNKLQERLEGTITRAFANVVLQETDLKKQEALYGFLANFNTVIATIDSMMDADDFEKYRIESHSKYRALLLDKTISFYIPTGYACFEDAFDKAYWEETQRDLKKAWDELRADPISGMPTGNILKIFDQLLVDSNNNIQEITTRKLGSYQNIYRATTYEVENAYTSIIPDPRYCEDNRWNNDGVAYLYLAYDENDLNYKNIRLVQKTCAEEIRLNCKKKVAFGSFVAVNPDVKILDLAYQKGAHASYNERLQNSPREFADQFYDGVPDDEIARLLHLAKQNKTDLLKKEIQQKRESLISEAMIQKRIYSTMIPAILSSICENVFVAVDKTDDPELEAYRPFRVFSRYLIERGYGGVAYRSTRMEMKGLEGYCLTVFEPSDMDCVPGSMEIYEHDADEYTLVRKW